MGVAVDLPDEAEPDDALLGAEDALLGVEDAPLVTGADDPPEAAEAEVCLAPLLEQEAMVGRVTPTLGVVS